MTGDGQAARTSRLTQHALGTVAHHSVTEPLCSSEGDPTRIAFAVSITYDHANQRMVVPSPLCKYPLKVLMGLNRLHARRVLTYRSP